VTSFTVIGEFNGRTVEITWIDGTLSGDQEILALVQRWAIGSEGELNNPYMASELMQSLLQDPEIVSGELPPMPEPPDGSQV
jgi:hypothetical protein